MVKNVRAVVPFQPRVLEISRECMRRREVSRAVRLQQDPQRVGLGESIVVCEVHPADPESVLFFEFVAVARQDVVVVGKHQAADREVGGRLGLLGWRRLGARLRDGEGRDPME
jgi:hypothetical protein